MPTSRAVLAIAQEVLRAQGFLHFISGEEQSYGASYHCWLATFLCVTIRHQTHLLCGDASSSVPVTQLSSAAAA